MNENIEKKVIYRIDILKEVKETLKRGVSPGLCSSLTMVLHKHGINMAITRAFPKYDYSIAKRKFNANLGKYYGCWWKQGKFGIFSGRRRFLNWLIKEYKDDKTNLYELVE